MRRLLRVLGVLSVLFLLGVVGDRLAADYAADQVERQLAAQGLRTPDVTIRGFPFVPQFINGRYRDVQVRSPALELPAGRVERISATLTGVELDNPRRPREARAETLTAAGTVPYAEIERAARVRNLKVKRGRPGEVALSGELKLLGRTVSVSARGRVEARGDHIRIVPTGFEVEGIGDVDRAVSNRLADRLSLDYPVAALPPGVTLRSITPSATGLVVQVSGRNTLLRAP